jgi:trk system potassium uptake protein TrkA
VTPKRVLVVGLGRFGSALVEELFDTDCELIVIDRSSDAVDACKAYASAAFVADAADPRVLESIGMRDVDVAVITAGESFEAVVLCVSQLSQLGVKTIFARATNDRQAHVLRAVGATRAVQVENEMGRRLAVQVLNPSAAHLMDFAMHFRVVPWTVTKPFVGKTLGEAKLRDYELNVLGYLRAGAGAGPSAAKAKPRMELPPPDYRIAAGDTLVLVGDETAFERFLGEVEA